MSCGTEPQQWLVTWPYAPGSAGPGRVLLYGNRCRVQRSQQLLVSVPLDLIRLDPERLVLGLYEFGLTETVPSIVAELLGLPDSWVVKAQQFMSAESQNP